MNVLQCTTDNRWPEALRQSAPSSAYRELFLLLLLYSVMRDKKNLSRLSLVFLNFIVLGSIKGTVLLFLLFPQDGSIEIASFSVMSALCDLRDALCHRNHQLDSFVSRSLKLGGSPVSALLNQLPIPRQLFQPGSVAQSLFSSLSYCKVLLRGVSREEKNGVAFQETAVVWRRKVIKSFTAFKE